jgi:hypothetical protein
VDTIRTSKRSEPSFSRFVMVRRGFARRAGIGVACGALAVPVPFAVTSVASCVPSAAPVTALTLPDASRQPDGVVIEPVPAVPDADERASANGVVALRAPLGSDAVVMVVRRLFRAFARDDADALQAILTEDAVVLGPSRGKGSLIDQWRSRVKNAAYARLAGLELVDGDRIARFTYDDLAVPGAPERPAAMKPGELLVRFAVPTPRLGSEQLFGDGMTLLLRREGRGYRIAGAGEENGP